MTATQGATVLEDYGGSVIASFLVLKFTGIYVYRCWRRQLAIANIGGCGEDVGSTVPKMASLDTPCGV
ncbi:hypothetical protein Y032_0608g599 [Ancylostoma ceylanicum]|uniref:Uncharacterized protein n=1 Tax=Ancylostoma ceylanicum TaxID=53326 RepID=A0A016WLN4_9BILA|nr:hypothetical protein Y032_0608g599 [Ancylostoma ceylanicum]